MASARRLFSSSSALAARPRGPPSRGAKDPLDITNLLAPGQQFDFPLTRPTILKMEQRRDFLHYLRLEHLQFKDLGQSELAGIGQALLELTAAADPSHAL